MYFARDNPPTQPTLRQKSNQTSFKGKLAERGCFIRLSLPIIRYEKETYNTTFELNCLVVKDLCTDLLISDRSIHKFGLFTKQIHLSEEDKAAVKLIKETTDPCSITVVEEIVNANCALPSAYIGAITTVDEPPKVIEADIKML